VIRALARLGNERARTGQDGCAVPIAVRVDANDVIRLLCKHPRHLHLLGAKSVPVWGSETAAAGL